MSRLLRLAISLLLVVPVACRDKGGSAEEARDPEFAGKNLMTADPAPKVVVNADLGGKVIYLGLDVDKTELKPGEKFTLTHYYKVITPPGSDYGIYTHVKGNGKDWMNVDATRMRSAYPPADWKAGDIIKDEQVITLKGDWKSPQANIIFGMYRRGGQSEGDRLPVVSGPNDGHRGVLAHTFNIAGMAKTPVAGTTDGFVIKKAAGPITIDGKADEPSWATANGTGAFKDLEGTTVPVAPTSARLLWDDKNLYVFFEITDGEVFSQYKKPDDTLWKEDVVELFIDADKSGQGYVELQVNPNNAQFDAWFAKTRATPGDFKWQSSMVSAVRVDGTADDRTDTDKGWSVEIAIPLEAVKGGDAAMAINLPPKVGDSWKLNLVRVEKGKDQKQITASAWAQITMADFHAIDRLLTVTFGDEGGKVASAPAEPAPAAADGSRSQAGPRPAPGLKMIKGLELSPEAKAKAEAEAKRSTEKKVAPSADAKRPEPPGPSAPRKGAATNE